MPLNAKKGHFLIESDLLIAVVQT